MWHRLQHLVQRSIRSDYLQHGLFWMLSYYLLYRLFRYSEETTRTDLIYTLLFHLSLVPVFYLNTQVLIPRFFRKGTYWLYSLLSLGLIASGALVNQYIFRYLADALFPGYYFISYYSWAELLQFTGAYWAVSTLLKLSRSWFTVREQEKQIEQLEQAASRAELRALKAQLDPHFLFNSLNNIYSLALYEDQRTPEALLKLSGSMRYVLYECSEPMVLLAREMKHLRDYLDLYAMGIDHEVERRVEVEVSSDELRIPPLLLLPLLENACKHSRPTSAGRHFIHLRIYEQGDSLQVTCRNSVQPVKDKRPGGVGLHNLQQRLRLLFGERFRLAQKTEAEQYQINLHIPLPKSPAL